MARLPREVLGVAEGASNAELKQAYRQLARKWYPNNNKASNATEMFQEIEGAYTALSNPEPGNINVGGGGGERVGRSHAGVGFGQVFSMFNFPLGPPPVRKQPFACTLEQLVQRDTKRWRVSRKRMDRDGQDEVVMLEALMDPTYRTGQRITFTGKGDIFHDGTAETLLFVLAVKPHPTFTLHGDDLHTTVAITLKEALCGVNTSLRDIYGEHTPITMERVHPTDHKIIIPHRGMPRSSDGGVRGGMVITFNIVHPETLTRAQVATLRSIL
jgi:DnaJ-class molecular chaperone